MRKHHEGWGCVYSAINLVKDLEYIGYDKTGDPVNHRWKHHCDEALKSRPRGYFQRALKKGGGFRGFKWSIVWRGPTEELAAKEVYYIAKRHTWVGDPKCRGYNLTIGGDGFHGKFSKKSKNKMRDAAVQQWASKTPEELLIIGKNHSEALQRYWSNATPEEVFVRAEKISVAAVRRFKDPNARKLSSEAAKNQWAGITFEERSTILKQRWAAIPQEDQVTIGKRRGIITKRRWDTMSSKDRVAIGKKISDTKRRAAKLKKK